uniref:Omega-theraphotoxin-Hhn1b n=1 Tax=Cyriopagopus hainanus TaxID=2781057 RepID=H9C01_CYRHA|nr:RecName: Full=Omega-theraphotoxin-Hhn1b; Short=Omega-TRTX-Hhn1b; AltName: Full=Hainantoxin-IX-3; Short=HNTX-IX-3; Flags: Precursor [Haplopelma hainanum]ADB56731.1 HNTX-IX-3 precursor [Haplopelma hainanum]
MKSIVFVALFGLALLAVVCSASEDAHKELLKEVVRAMVVDKTDAVQAEERKCRWYLGGCSQDGDCCKHLQCHSNYEWCVWDGTFSK